MVDLGVSDNLKQLVNQFQDEFIQKQKTAILKKDIRFSSKLKNTFFKHSSQLHQKLWKPLEDTGLLKSKKIIIVPDGFLHYLPFELLIKNQEQKEYTDYHYLVKDYPISYYPSATVLHFERTKEIKERKAQKKFFGLAVEDFSNNHCYETKTTFPNLSHSSKEVNSIANLFSQNSQYTLTNQFATENKLKSIDLSQYRYLHFSTHGLINSEKPDFSRILLQPSESNDGCLNLYEIFDLNFNADLVTLSACESGLGQLVQGEGMVGFTRALMYAGTPSMILSLWKVADESTSDLFVNYYSKLQRNKGTNKYTPLREVQLEMIESEKYSNPYYWAPFIFIGER